MARADHRTERRSTVLRLLVALVVIGGAYAGLCIWSSKHVPSNVEVGGIKVGGMSPEQARAAIVRGSKPVLETPIVLSVPDTAEKFQVVPAKAGLAVDAARPLDGLVGFTLSPTTVWSKLTGSVSLPLPTRVDDRRLRAAVQALAAEVAVKPTEGAITFPEGRLTVDLPSPGRALDVAETTLALRQAFPDQTVAAAAVTPVEPAMSAERLQEIADGFPMTAMSGPVSLVSGASTVQLTPADFAPMVRMVPDGGAGLKPAWDEKKLTALVSSKVTVPTKPPSNARWVFEANNGKPRLIPSVDGSAVDEPALTKQVIAAIGSDQRTVDVKLVPVKPAFTTQDAQAAGVTTMIVDFTSPFPPEDTTRTQNLRVATRTINGTYVPPGGTFSLNGILGERTTAKGYADGTVILNGRLTRGTGGGVSQVSTVIYNLAYFAGVDFLEFRPHGFFIPRYPEGREATVYWRSIDNRWKNDTPYGMLLQTWVEGDVVRGRVWSTKTWDITSIKGPRSNVKPPKDLRDDSLTCYPQQPSPGFDVTVTRRWYRPGDPTLVKSEAVSTHYMPEDKITCTNPKARP